MSRGQQFASGVAVPKGMLPHQVDELNRLAAAIFEAKVTLDVISPRVGYTFKDPPAMINRLLMAGRQPIQGRYRA